MKSSTALAIGLASLISFGAAAGGYDAGLAQSYARLFEPAVGAQTGKALHLMKPGQFVNDLQKGKQIVALDIRTPRECGVLGMTLPVRVSIPINEVFLAEYLDRIPRDRPVVIVCQSGSRAVAVGIALRHVGFDNVYVLKGGLMGLSKYLNAKTANPPPKVAVR